MVIRRGDVWWADLGEPRGFKAAYRRPVVVVQDDSLNRSAFQTIVIVPLTSNLERSGPITNVLLSSAATGLPKDSVAICPQIEAINRDDFVKYVAAINREGMEALDYALQVTLGLLP